jgi:hypothetical protein
MQFGTLFVANASCKGRKVIYVTRAFTNYSIMWLEIYLDAA